MARERESDVDAWVVAADFGSELEARLAAATLESAGIPSTIGKDDVGGMRPHLQWSVGVRLFVPPDLAAEARELLGE